MFNEIRKHKIAYSFLLLGLVMFVFLFLAAWPSRIWQRTLAILLFVFYVTWGGVTHVKAKHFSKKILYEYLGVGTFGAIILLLMTL